MIRNRRRSIRTVDSHTEGNPTRVIVGGALVPPGGTLLDKQAWLMKHDDDLRRMLCFEPRGGGLMCSVFLMPPIDGGADFSVLIMEQGAYVPMSGHCIIGTATTAVETGLVAMVEPVTIVRFETPAGIVTCNVEVDNGQVGAVSIENVESFLHMAAVPIDVARLGSLKVDIAYGGDYYAIVDADEIGLRLSPTEDRAIVEVSVAVREAVAGQLDIRHPEIEHIQRCYQVMFVSNGTSAGDYKQTIVSPPGAIDRSPCGTGTSARIAKLYAEGRIGINEKRLFEGILGTCFEAWVNKAEERNGMLFIKPVIRGRAYITGYHHFVLAENDPFPAGFAMGPGGGEAPF